MRDIFVFLVIFGSLPFTIKRPVIGVLMFTWVSLMNPHRLTYGPAFSFPFAAVIAVTTLIGMAASRERKKLPMTPLVVVLIMFIAWMTVTCFPALEPDRAWTEWNRVIKGMFMIMVTLMVIRTEAELKAYVWVIALSVGFYGTKGGLFTLLTGGASRVTGPADSYIADNNDLALALVMTIPLIWYLHGQATKKWMRLGLLGAAVLTLTAAAGSYSRGALLAGGAMLFFLWVKSPGKVRTGLVMLLAIPLVFVAMPPQWFDRMASIDDYKADGSALGRINAWHFATNVANHNLTGGGLRCFTPAMFKVYAPDPLNVHAPHSIYFQVLGEQGYIGLALFLVLLVLAWRSATRVSRFCRDKEELKWAARLAAMCQVSMIGYLVGGAFLSLAYFDLFYDIVAVMVLAEKLLIRNEGEARAPDPRTGVPAAAGARLR